MTVPQRKERDEKGCISDYQRYFPNKNEEEECNSQNISQRRKYPPFDVIGRNCVAKCLSSSPLGDIRYLTLMPFPGVDISLAAESALSTTKILGDAFATLGVTDIP